MINLSSTSTNYSAATKRNFFQGNAKYSRSWKPKISRPSSSTSCTIYCSAFSPTISGKSYVVACTSNGLICVWDSKCGSSDPIIRVAASTADKVLYDVQFIDCKRENLLVVSGDPGTLIYKWSAFLSAIDSQEQFTNGNVFLEPITNFIPHPSPSGPVEFNCASYSAVDGMLYAGAGDAFGCYKFDLGTEKLVGTFGRGSHSDYLHDVMSLPNHNKLVLTAGEDGAIAFWDSNEMQLIEKINIQDTLNKNKHSVTRQQNNGFGSTQQLGNVSKSWVSSMDRKGDWLVAVGGSESGNILRSGPSSSGFMSIFHLPTRTFNAGCITRESYNAVTYNHHLDSFVSGGNDGQIAFWDSSTGMCTGRAGCSSSLIYALSCNTAQSTMLAGGTGGALNCFIDRIKTSNLTT